jgi:hypothetical protein
MTFSCLLAALVVSLSNAAGGGHGLVVDDVAGAAGGRAAATAAAQAVVVEIDAATGEMSEVKRDVDQTDDPMTSTMSTTSDANDATSSSSAAATAENEGKKNDTHNKLNSRIITTTATTTATATTTTTRTTAAAETTTETTTETPLQLECGIWLAPSALEGAGLGMYAGRDFSKGERLQTRGDLAIPIVDIVAHNRFDGASGLFEFLWDEYTWNAADLSMENEGYFDINGASPGFGSAANSFLPLKNVAESYVDVDSAGLHRSHDPGCGAFTYYHNRKSVASQDIVAFEEL